MIRKVDMKKLSLVCLTFFILLMFGCTSKEGKVNVIKGPGSANNSLMVSFNELCTGEAEGFLGKGDHILVSKEVDEKRIFSVVNSASKEEDTLLSVQAGKNYSLEISQDGTKLLFNNLLVDIETKKAIHLPVLEELTLLKSEEFIYPPSYSFVNKNEVVLTDPFYYITKFYPLMKEASGFRLDSGYRRINFEIAYDSKLNKDIIKDFAKIKKPDIDYIKKPKLLLDELKYTFIGYLKSSKNTRLYVLDLYKKEFKVIDNNVKDYTLSPDHRKIAYIKTDTRSPYSYSLFTANIDRTNRREVLQLPFISGLEWSKNSDWIAYSGGKSSSCDIGIIKEDGRQREQLTHGMNSTDKLSWSPSGDKIAFTSYGSSDPRVYIIKLNIEDRPYTSEKNYKSQERSAMSKMLLETLRKETTSVMKQLGSELF